MVPIVHNTHRSGVSHDLTIISDYVSSSGQWAVDYMTVVDNVGVV